MVTNGVMSFRQWASSWRRHACASVRAFVQQASVSNDIDYQMRCLYCKQIDPGGRATDNRRQQLVLVVLVVSLTS